MTEQEEVRDFMEHDAIADGQAVSDMVKTDGWAVILARIESKRAEYAERLDALPLDADDKEVLLLRVRSKLVREVLSIPDEVIAVGALALEDRKERAEERRHAEEDAEHKRRIDAEFQAELDAFRQPISAG